MLTATQPKECMLCKKPVRGRSDKKFCDHYCRAAFNNELKSPVNNFIRNVNNALTRNRRILESYLPEQQSMKKIKREKLVQAGFLFKYITHTYTNSKSNVYFFCYEYGYVPISPEWLMIVKKNKQ